MTVNAAVRVTPLYVAEIVTDRVVDTADVATVNPDAVDPAPTVTLDGRLATAGSLLANATTAPPAGAPADSDTNPDVLSPPATLDGLIVTLFSVTPAPAGVIVSVAERVEPLYVAVIVAVVVAETADVVTVKFPANPFGGTVVVAGTLATAGLLLDNEITAPSVADTSVTTVPADCAPPSTVVGLRSMVDNCAGGGAACGVTVRTADHAPAWPAELMERTRQE